MSPARILHIARREWLEQLRQPTMIAVIASLFLIVGGVSLVCLWMLEQVEPETLGMLEGVVQAAGLEDGYALKELAGSMVAAYNFLIFTQFLGIASVLAGHAVLHDRQVGTLTFLLLAPVSRVELLAGKVLGALGPSFVLYATISGTACLIATTWDVTAPFADQLPPSPSWLVAFLIGGPMWALFIGTICTIVSSLAHDVRTAQQAVWFVVFFASLFCGLLLSYLLTQGVVLQLASAGLAALGTVGAMIVGSQIISRDISR